MKLLRNMRMNALDKLSPVKQHVVMQAMGLSGDVPLLAKRLMDQ
ncbi:hypothetical protein [Neptunomonas antarctica]|nr:hypothetical protein [Neptunomonas antarctica]